MAFIKLPTFKKARVPEKIFEAPAISAKDIIAPSSIALFSDHLKLGERLAKSFFIFSYPRYLSTAWFSPVINLDTPMDIGFHIHPIETGLVLKQLRKKVTEVVAEITEREEKGLIRDPALETAYQDLESLRDRLQTAQERMFKFGLYLTVYGDNPKQIEEIETTLRSILESRLIYIKPALYQQREGFNCTCPYGLDQLQVHTSMNTDPLSSTFPFVSFDLSSNEGILYGINRHNNSLILFDRFSLENANSCFFAKAGSGKTTRWDTPVLIRNKYKTQLIKIGPFIEKLIKKYGAAPIDEEIEGVINPPKIRVYSFDKNLRGRWSKVTVAMRKKAPKEFYKITTRSGREITTTGDHNMVVLRDGKVIVAKSSEVKEGEYVPLPRKIHFPERSSWCTLNVLNTNVKQHKLRIGKGRHKIYLPTNDNFLKLAGFITAEGTVRKSYVEISNTEKEILNKIKIFLKRLNIPFYETFNKNKVDGIRTNNEKFVEVVNLLRGGGRSGQKRVWPFIFNLKKEKVAQYLSAYFEGDGGIGKDRFTIEASSKSKRLISEMAYLLYFFGIIGRLRKTRKKPTNSNWERKKNYYELSISGQNNLRKFAENINFISKRKREQLSKIIQKEGNTNVDVIPEISSIFKEIDQLLGCQLHRMQDISEIKRRTYNPSPEKLKEVIIRIEQRIQNFKDLTSTFKILSELPELATIIELGGNKKKLNSALWKTLGWSWGLMKNQRVESKSLNVLKALNIVNGSNYSLGKIKEVLRSGFQEMDLPIKYYNQSLQCQLAGRIKENTSYQTIQKATQFIWQNYQDILENKIPQVEEKLAQLKLLANSDLFWDSIVKIKKFENKKDKYVYDLTVDNEVFLAGQGGMFVHNSYAVKLEILRSLMAGTDVLVLDPENEYKFLADAIGGSFFNISLASPNHINPFDLPTPREDEKPEDVLRSNIINLVGLLRIMLGGLTPEEDAIIDRALAETYGARDITPETDPSTWKERIPLMSDLEAVLEGMEGAESLVRRVRKFTKGTFAQFFNQPTNISMDKPFVVFGIRDMEDELRPIAMFVIMRYIWNKVRSELKKRILVVDEAWWIMQTEDGASFLYGMAKRARKYWLGVTTITQDIGDFMKSSYGQPIITNSSLQLLMKQSPATIDVVQKTFNLTEEEKYLLLEAEVGEGIFFAGQKHVAIKTVASYAEDQIITTAPEEILKIKRARGEL